MRNPAFVVTPAALITALITERGVLAPPTRAAVRALLDKLYAGAPYTLAAYMIEGRGSKTAEKVRWKERPGSG